MPGAAARLRSGDVMAQDLDAAIEPVELEQRVKRLTRGRLHGPDAGDGGQAGPRSSASIASHPVCWA